jgi:hypothetical protein
MSSIPKILSVSELSAQDAKSVCPMLFHLLPTSSAHHADGSLFRRSNILMLKEKKYFRQGI